MVMQKIERSANGQWTQVGTIQDEHVEITELRLISALRDGIAIPAHASQEYGGLKIVSKNDPWFVKAFVSFYLPKHAHELRVIEVPPL